MVDIRNTRQRRAVSAVLDELEGFASAQQIHGVLGQRGEKVGLSTVYRNLQALVDAEQVDALRGNDGEVLYRRCEAGEHHHHLVCRSCGTITDVDCAVGQAPCLTPSDPTGSLDGFVVDEAEVVYWGLCPECSMKETSRSHP